MKFSLIHFKLPMLLVFIIAGHFAMAESTFDDKADAVYFEYASLLNLECY